MDKTRGLKRGGEVLNRRIVAINNQESNYFVWVRSKPGRYIREVGLCGPSVKEAAGGVAEVDGAVDDASLPLKHTDAIGELGGHAVVLVACGVLGDGKGAIVRSNVGYIAVGPGTESWIAVAGLTR